MAVLTFKFDESYDRDLMCVGGVIGTNADWSRLESRWQLCIDRQNAKSREDQQITRFHASNLNARSYEFTNWTPEMSARFSKKLLSLLTHRKMGAVAVAVDLNAVRRAFPNGGDKREAGAYVYAMKSMMIDLAALVREHFPGDKLLLVHDHGNWDVPALRGYKLFVDEPAWKPRDLFLGMTSAPGTQCIGLQAADLICYEVFRGVKKGSAELAREARSAFDHLLKKSFCGASDTSNCRKSKR